MTRTPDSDFRRVTVRVGSSLGLSSLTEAADEELENVLVTPLPCPSRCSESDIMPVTSDSLSHGADSEAKYMPVHFNSDCYWASRLWPAAVTQAPSQPGASELAILRLRLEPESESESAAPGVTQVEVATQSHWQGAAGHWQSLSPWPPVTVPRLKVTVRRLSPPGPAPAAWPGLGSNYYDHDSSFKFPATRSQYLTQPGCQPE
jgi:hypothetical protein